MRKIWFFCDKCKDLIASQRLPVGFKVERHLTQVGHQEWCGECLNESNIGEVVDVNDPKFSLED